MRLLACGYLRHLISATACAASLLFASGGAATPKPWQVEISIAGGQSEATSRPEFERVVKSQIAELKPKALRCRSTCVISATLVSLELQRRDEQVVAACSVSAAVRDQRSGSIRAVMRGRARASDQQTRAERTRVAAMEAAVHSALSGLEEARP